MEEDLERLVAYTYLTVPDRAAYVSVMRVFTSTLLADLSAHDLAERLGDRFTVETLAAKLEQLRIWGNLIPSSRPVKAGSIPGYSCTPATATAGWAPSETSRPTSRTFVRPSTANGTC